MASSDALKRQILSVSIGGSVVDRHAVSFRLQTASGFHAVAARLLYPADSDVGQVDDAITVSLITDNKTDLYFTGKIYSAALQNSTRQQFSIYQIFPILKHGKGTITGTSGSL
jgi:hypothetical protein